MRILDRLERIFGKFAIKNLIVYIIFLNFGVFALGLINDQVISKLLLDPSLVLQGEVWRLITYIFIPPSTSIIFILFVLSLYYMIGIGLEREWGTFKFNIYYLIGIIGTTLSAFIANGSVTSEYLNLSLFLAFAYMFPNFEIMLFLILPIKMKYLAWLDVVFLAFSFFTGSITDKFAIAAALLNFLLFFGLDIIRSLKNSGNSLYRKKKYSTQFIKKGSYHKCYVCGITEIDNYDAEFRYCGTCEGSYEYCMEHLKSHEHKKKST